MFATFHKQTSFCYRTAGYFEHNYMFLPSGDAMKWNESGFRPPLCTYRLNCARRTSWGWWDDWDDTVLQTQDSTRHLSVTEDPHNTDFHTWMGKKHFCFFQTAETGNRTPNSGVKGSGANHYPRAPALPSVKSVGRIDAYENDYITKTLATLQIYCSKIHEFMIKINWSCKISSCRSIKNYWSQHRLGID